MHSTGTKYGNQEESFVNIEENPANLIRSRKAQSRINSVNRRFECLKRKTVKVGRVGSPKSLCKIYSNY